MTTVFLSSGDLLADRRARYAEMLLDGGDAAAAADVMRQAVELVPEWAAGFFRLGEIAHVAGAFETAAEAWRNVLRLDPDDRFGAALRLASIGLLPTPGAPPPAYVESLFDAYAPTFEEALVGKLDYRAPELIARSIETVRPAGLFRHVVDLGCGTGLMGEYLRARTSLLEGIDLSEAMLQKAAEKRVYDRLDRGDINMLAPPEVKADLVVAADVFVYLGDLEAAFRVVASTLEPGGLFCFSAEENFGEEDFVLAASLRYAHSQPYVRRLLRARGFAVVDLAQAELRRDRDVPVAGLIVTAERKGLAAADDAAYVPPAVRRVRDRL